MKRKVLILSPDRSVYQGIKSDLSGYKPNLYTCIWSANDNEIPDSDICLIDENFIGERATDYLGQFAFNLSPRPIIFLTEAIRSEKDYKAIKSLSTDYLLKSNINPSSLHNAIIYGLDSANLRLEIENQQRRYESLFHGAVDPAFFLKADWKVETVNDAFKNMFGIGDDDDARSFNFRDFFYNQSDFEELQRDLTTEKKNKLDVEYRFKKPDESGRYLGHLKIAVLRDTVFHEGTHKEVVRGFHGTLSNISYRQKLI
ncbi:MAG TPA: PAS domain-containing protein, partial [Cryomorphaceae bacterium]|nr:PAS domain-containing protein [Cryomorphaceae bacterium]